MFIRGRTAWCRRLWCSSPIGPIESGLAGIEAALRDTRAFDPGTSDRGLFRLLGNDLAADGLHPPCCGTWFGVAPDIRLAGDGGLPANEARHAMSEGTIDLAVGNWPEIGSDYHRHNLFTETFVVLMSQSNYWPGRAERRRLSGGPACDYRPVETVGLR